MCTTREKAAVAEQVFQIQSGKDAVVGFRKTGDAVIRFCGRIDTELMLLKALRLLQGPLRRQNAVGGLEPLTHYAIENQRRQQS